MWKTGINAYASCDGARRCKKSMASQLSLKLNSTARFPVLNHHGDLCASGSVMYARGFALNLCVRGATADTTWWDSEGVLRGGGLCRSPCQRGMLAFASTSTCSTSVPNPNYIANGGWTWVLNSVQPPCAGLWHFHNPISLGSKSHYPIIPFIILGSKSHNPIILASKSRCP